MKTMTAHVSAQDIAEGAACKADGCPVALAIQRLLDPDYICIVTDVEIGLFHRHAYKQVSSYCPLYLRTPSQASDFIRAFDGGGNNCQPFSFSLEILEEYLQ